VGATVIRPGDLDPKIARGFDRVAPIYDGLARLFPGDALRAAAEVFLSRLRPGAVVLVVGGGAGRILPALLRTAPARVVWVDASDGMTARARRRANGDARVAFRVGGLETIGREERFDAVVTPFFLDLFESAGLASVVGRLAATLGPDGEWIHADFAHDRFRPLSSLLYALFRVGCGVEARQVADWDEVFAGEGFVAVERHAALDGWLCAMRLCRTVNVSGD
jgi:ubiquinone/menaquinone biosynthesis C-methylase UbiE